MPLHENVLENLVVHGLNIRHFERTTDVKYMLHLGTTHHFESSGIDMTLIVYYQRKKENSDQCMSITTSSKYRCLDLVLCGIMKMMEVGEDTTRLNMFSYFGKYYKYTC